MTVLLIRANRNEADEAALNHCGLQTLTDPYLEVTQVDNPSGAARMLEAITSGQAGWLVISSLNALHYWSAQLPSGELTEALAARDDLRIAAIGPSTAAAARDIGATEVVTPETGTSRVLADLLAEFPSSLVVVPSGSISMRSLPDTLVPRGFTVLEEVVYQTTSPSAAPKSAGTLDTLGITDVLFRSPSAVRSFVEFNPHLPDGIRLFATGPTTAQQMEQLGLAVRATCPDSSPETVAQTLASIIEEDQ